MAFLWLQDASQPGAWHRPGVPDFVTRSNRSNTTLVQHRSRITPQPHSSRVLTKTLYTFLARRPPPG